jgi:hypothetical protein
MLTSLPHELAGLVEQDVASALSLLKVVAP